MEWITTREAAEYLKVDASRVRQLCTEGRIHCQKFGHVWMVERASIEAYATTYRKPGPKPKSTNEEE